MACHISLIGTMLPISLFIQLPYFRLHGFGTVPFMDCFLWDIYIRCTSGPVQSVLYMVPEVDGSLARRGNVAFGVQFSI